MFRIATCFIVFAMVFCSSALSKQQEKTQEASKNAKNVLDKKNNSTPDTSAPAKLKNPNSAQETPSTDASQQAIINNAAEFKKKLGEMLEAQKKYIAKLREQIANSRQAPFEPDLYMQLGEALSKEADILYFVQQEKFADLKDQNKESAVLDSQNSPVTVAQKESIVNYEKVIQEFPKYKNLDKVYYRLARGYRIVGDRKGFLINVKTVIDKYPKSKYFSKSQILLGEDTFERGLFEESLAIFQKISISAEVYERNLARHKIGLIYIALKNYVGSLKMFESVVLDPDLERFKAQNSSSKGILLKREALIDSIRAYIALESKDAKKDPKSDTFKKDDLYTTDPVDYYYKVSPNEELYLDVLEKISKQYIESKKYEKAIFIFGELANRVRDPRKTVSLLKQTLTATPFEHRNIFKVEDLRIALDALRTVKKFVSIPDKDKKELEDFFELQLRELATRLHDQNKQKFNQEDLNKAIGFYELYVQYFNTQRPELSKMSTNLGDAYLLNKDYLNSGQVYFKTAEGRYGKVDAATKQKLYENVIFVLWDKLQGKKDNLSFYQKVRCNGILINVLEKYFKLLPDKKKKSQLAYALARSYFDAGFYAKGINSLYLIVKDYPSSSEAVTAGEAILDYYNVKAEYISLEAWIKKLEQANVTDPGFKQHLQAMKSASRSKALQERVEKISGLNEFAQGASFLQAASQVKDESLKDELLQAALSKAKQEADLDNFKATVKQMTQSEKDPNKKAQILQKLAYELYALGDYGGALEAYQSSLSFYTKPEDQKASIARILGVLLGIRDWNGLASLLQKEFNSLDAAMQKQVISEIINAIRSGQVLPESIVSVVLRQARVSPLATDQIYFLNKGASSFSESQQQAWAGVLNAACSGSKRLPFCVTPRWIQLVDKSPGNASLSAKIFEKKLKMLPLRLEDVESAGKDFQGKTQMLQGFLGSGDAPLEAAVSKELGFFYHYFGDFLIRVGNKNPDLKPVLSQKAQESHQQGDSYKKNCENIMQQQGSFFDQSNAICSKDSMRTEVFFKIKKKSLVSVKSGITDNIKILQKSLFKSATPDLWLNLVKDFYKNKNYHYSLFAGVDGLQRYPAKEKELKLVLACSLKNLNYHEESEQVFKEVGVSQGADQRCEDV